MKLEYENGRLLVERADGLRWQPGDVAKPRFDFEYDALSVSDERAVRRLGPSLYPLAVDQIHEVRAFVERLDPPPEATLQKQVTAELRALARGLIGSVVTQLGYDGLLDVMITARADSTDLYASEARRVLGYVDAVWNAFHGLAAQIAATPAAEVRTVKQYAELMPFPPPPEHFAGGVLEELFGGVPRDH